MGLAMWFLKSISSYVGDKNDIKYFLLVTVQAIDEVLRKVLLKQSTFNLDTLCTLLIIIYIYFL